MKVFIATLSLSLVLGGCLTHLSPEQLKALPQNNAGACLAAGVQTPVPYAGTAGFDAGWLAAPGKLSVGKDGSCTIEIYLPAPVKE